MDEYPFYPRFDITNGRISMANRATKVMRQPSSISRLWSQSGQRVESGRRVERVAGKDGSIMGGDWDAGPINEQCYA